MEAKLQVRTPELSRGGRAKPRFLSEDGGDARSQVYLKSVWVLTSLRHPALRLAGCALHALCCFFLCASSPLLASLQSPGRFPIFGDWVHMTSTGFTWEKLVFQTLIGLALLALLRFTLYPRLLQRQWNWKRAYRHATQVFSRLSRLSGVDVAATSASAGEKADEELSERVMTLQTFASGLAADSRMVRLSVWNTGWTHGSWTFVMVLFPFLWAIVMYVVRKLVRHSALESVLFPEDEDEDSSAGPRQLEVQLALYVVLLALSCFKLLVTLDWVLQDRDYSRVFFGNWLHLLRRVYSEFAVVRLLWCWLSLTGLLVAGVYFGGLRELQKQWLEWNLSEARGDSSPWLSNSSWRAMLSALVVALDLLWLLQDWQFPCFASPLGVRIFGLPIDQFTLRLPLRLQVCFCSKWLGLFVVLALLLPLEICQFLQIAGYSPRSYSQFVDSTTFRVLPLNGTSSGSSSGDGFPTDLDAITRQLLHHGSISRFFPWSAWDRVPAYALQMLAVAAVVWLWQKERCKMCFAVFLGLPTAQAESARRVASINEAVPPKTKRVLTTQRRLRKLYGLRARSDSFCIGLAALSVLTVLLQFRAIWRSRGKDDHSLPLQSPGETYATLLLLVTLVLLHQLVHRYRIKMEIMVLRNRIPVDCRDSLWRSPRTLFLPFLAELLLCGVCLPPLVHGRIYLREERYALPKTSIAVLPSCPAQLTMTSGNQTCELQYSYPLEIVNMVVLVRLYWFARVIRNQVLKKIVADKAFMGSGALLTGAHMPVDSLWWSFRVSFALRPVRLLLTLFFMLWAGTAAAVAIFERPFPSPLDGEDHALWLTLVTMTAVGYGESYPVTANGRVATTLGAMIGGLIFVCLMTSEFLESLKGSKREHTVVTTLDNMRWNRSLRFLGARLIEVAWRRHRHCHLQSEGSSSTVRKKEAGLSKALTRAAHQFKRCRKLKPKQSSESLRNLQTNALSEWRTHELDGWIARTRAETLASLEALEKQMDVMERSVQALL